MYIFRKKIFQLRKCDGLVEAKTVVLAKVGPFTVTGHCYEASGNTKATTFLSSSEEGSFAQSYEGNVNSGAPLPEGEEVGQGVWMQGASGPACSFSGYLVEE